MPAELIPVAIVLTSFDHGGTERQMTELICRLDSSRFQVHAVCFHRTGPWLRRVEQAAHEVVEFPLRSFKSPSTIGTMGRFVEWLASRRIAVVHACDRYANVFGLPGAALARVPVRIGSRRELTPPDLTRSLAGALRLAYHAAHRVVANSSAAADILRAAGVAASKIALIPNGIDLAAFPPVGDRESRRSLAMVANLRPGKGHEPLLRAFAAARRTVPELRLRLIGDGPLRGPLIALASELGVAEATEFLGHIDHVPHALSSSELYVFPSASEAFPNGLIEGMAAGLPVVATATGGIPELIDDRRNGLLVPVGDIDALARAIVALVEDPALANRLGRAARQTIAARYGVDRMVAAFEQLYLSELAARGLRSSHARELLVS